MLTKNSILKMQESQKRAISRAMINSKESKLRYLQKLQNRELSLRSGYYLMDRSYNTKEGHCKLSRQRTLQHELAKAKVMLLCMQLGYQVYSEIVFTNKSIGDIYLPEILRVYEILGSETLDMFKEKAKSYPEEIEIIPLSSEEILKEGFLL